MLYLRIWGEFRDIKELWGRFTGNKGCFSSRFTDFLVVDLMIYFDSLFGSIIRQNDKKFIKYI